MTRTPFTFDDFIAQMNQVKKLGPMGKMMGMIPGMGDMMKQIDMREDEIDNQLTRMRAMYDSMTRDERKQPDLIQQSRRLRIARGAGVDLADVIKLLKDFEQARSMMRAVASMGITAGLSTSRPSQVLGLVTSDPAHRDPSHIPYSANRRLFHASVLLVALITALAILAFRWMHP